MTRTLKHFIYLFLFIALSACSGNSLTVTSDNKEEPINETLSESIILLHVNDIHANMDNFPKIAAYIEELRNTNENVFLLSAGDLFSGNPFVDQHERPGYPLIHLMNELKFDASALGNHEFDHGQKVLNERMDDANFPFLCANIDTQNAVLNQPQPYIILKTANDFPIVVLGLIETGTKIDGRYIPSTHPDKVNDCNFLYYKSIAGEYTHLKKEDNLFLVLSHLGQGTDVKLADRYSEIDLIIGGHSHSTIKNPYIQNNALICQAGSKGKYIGRIDIKIEEGKIKSESAQLIETEKLSAVNSRIQSIVDQYNNNSAMKRIIAQNKSILSNKNELGALMTDAVNWKLKTDIAFQNSGGIRSSLPQGEITVGQVYELDPFNNDIILFELSCDEIRSLLNSTSEGDLKVAGINYRYLGQGNIQLENYDGTLLDESQTYKVGLNSYIASAYNFDHNDIGQNSSVASSNCLMEFLEFKKEINYNGINRIFKN
ncbi:MAG: bifunctional UDP-sugar hydrolase/5'-nucleotidase [Marinifilaceae bacterium]